MTRTILLKRLRAFTEEVTADLIMPTRLQKGDTEQIFRPAKVYLMRLPDGTSATKKAPYVLHQVITGMDQQPQGQCVTSSAKVRSICCVYNDDEQNRTRRGIIAQQAQKVDPQYVKQVNTSYMRNGEQVNDDRLQLDNNVIMMDTLAAVKVLIKRVDELEERLNKIPE